MNKYSKALQACDMLASVKRSKDSERSMWLLPGTVNQSQERFSAQPLAMHTSPLADKGSNFCRKHCKLLKLAVCQ